MGFQVSFIDNERNWLNLDLNQKKESFKKIIDGQKKIWLLSLNIIE